MMELLKRVKSTPRMGREAPRPSVLSAKSAAKTTRLSLSELIPNGRRKRDSRGDKRLTLLCTPDHSDSAPEVIHEEFLNGLVSIPCRLERVSASASSICSDDRATPGSRLRSVSGVSTVRSARPSDTPSEAHGL